MHRYNSRVAYASHLQKDGNVENGGSGIMLQGCISIDMPTKSKIIEEILLGVQIFTITGLKGSMEAARTSTMFHSTPRKWAATVETIGTIQ